MTENTEGTARAAVITIESGGTTGPCRLTARCGSRIFSACTMFRWTCPAAGGEPAASAGWLPGALSPLTQAERESLTEEERESGVRLACLTTVEGEARISVPEFAAMAVIEAGGDAPDYRSTRPPTAMARRWISAPPRSRCIFTTWPPANSCIRPPGVTRRRCTGLT